MIQYQQIDKIRQIIINRQMNFLNIDFKQMQSNSNKENKKKMGKPQQLNEYFNKFTKQLKELKKIDLLSQQQNQIYVDEQKSYVVVSAAYINQLKTSHKEVTAKVQEVLDLIKICEDNCALLNNTITIKDRQIKDLNMKNSMYVKSREQIIARIREYEKKLQQRDRDISLLTNKLTSLNITKNDISQVNKKVLTLTDKWTQVEFDAEVVWIGNIDEELENKDKEGKKSEGKEREIRGQNFSFSPNSLQDQMKILKIRFEDVLKNLNQQMADKMSQIEQQRINIEKYCEENRRLRSENEQLKKNIIQIDEQKEKVKIWRSMLGQSVERIIKNYSPDQQKLQKSSIITGSMGSEAVSIAAEEKIKSLQATVDRLQFQQRQRSRKAAEVRKMLDEVQVQSISEQNIVGTILGLSAKIKEAVRFLLEQL